MTRRWSLIAVIAALAVALAVVLVNLGSGTAAGSRPADRTGRAAASSNLRGVGWWPAHEKAGVVAADAVGGHDAQLLGGASWTDGPHGGALLFNGSSGYADTGARLLDTVGGDYSVAAWVRLDAEGGRRLLHGRQ